MSAVVYRVFDAKDQLLYIGSTRDFGSRKAVHLSTRDTPIAFTIQTCAARWETQEFPGIRTARAAEREAITAEAPFLNRMHNPSRWARRGTQWVPLLPEYQPVHFWAETDPEVMAEIGRLLGVAT